MINKKKILIDLNSIFKKIFNDKNLSLKLNTKKENILEWDSLGTIKIIIAIQKKYKISISPNESQNIQNINNLIQIISKKIK